MKTASRKIRVAAIALCTVFALCSFALAVGAVDTTKTCSLSVTLGTTYTDAEKANLNITANLYKVAEFTGDTYTYTPLSGFDTDLSNFVSFTPEQNKAAALAAQQVVETAGTPAAATTGVFAGGATGTFTPVPCGLYLMTATAVDTTAAYNYTFAPVLLSLPSMNTDGSDNYNYDISNLELKLSREPATTSLKIKKDLTTFSELQGPATFIFKVEAVKGDATVYSNVISMVFTKAESQTVEIGNLPIGATVTVTEVYGGGSYSVKTDAEQVITLTKPEPNAEPATAAFVNDYNKKTPSSHSVTNRVTPTGIEQHIESAPAVQ